MNLRLLLATVLTVPMLAAAHCDTLDGPVVGAARKALDSGEVNPALVWVKKEDEAEIRRAFDRAGYTGLKPAGAVEPAVAAADRAIATGNLQPLALLVAERIEQGLHRHFDAVMAGKKFASSDVAAGRAFANAYVEFVHYAERLYDAGESLAPPSAGKAPAAHTH